MHAAAALERWQEQKRLELQDRLRDIGMEKVFKEDYELDDAMDEDEDDGDGPDGMNGTLAS